MNGFKIYTNNGWERIVSLCYNGLMKIDELIFFKRSKRQVNAMHIVVMGLNYRTAPVEFREKFAISADRLPEALRELKRNRNVLECVIVGTCNRTEIYAVVDRLKTCGQSIRSFMERWFNIPREALTAHLYGHEDREAINHLFRVACGLDSMVVGETQILGQVRDAFLSAQSEQMTGTFFNTLFKQAVTLAKRAHSETSIGENPVSVSYAAVELGKRIFGHFRKKAVMIVGAGKMGELTVKHLHANGAEKVLVVNRTLPKAQELADKFGGTAFAFEDMMSCLSEADILISSTGSREPVLTRKQAEEVMRKRKSRPLFMIDIAVPRDLDPRIGELSNVYLYDIDDLQSIVETNLAGRRHEAAKIEEMIKSEIAAFDQWYKMLGVAPVIKALQDKSNQIHQEVMDSMMKKLPDLDEKERKVIRKLTKSIVNQMMRDPIVRIKDMAAEKNGDEALQIFARMFALEDRLAEQEKAGSSSQEVSEAVEEDGDESSDHATSVSMQTDDLYART